jgi:ABC-type multidrug transport system permease subunit
MMPGNLFRLQLADAFANRRRFALRVGISVLLALPFIFIAMPARAQAAGIVMVILFTSFFGTAVAHVHLRDDRRLERLTLLPTPRWALWLDLVLASVLSRFVPTAVVVAGFALVNGQSLTIGALIALAGWLCTTLLLLTLLGIAIAGRVRSNAEVHLFGALTVGILAPLSGLTPLPDRLEPLTATAAFNPISRFLAALVRTTTTHATVPAVEITFASFVILIVVVLAIFRWIAGAPGSPKGFDTTSTTVNNGATSKG